MYSSAFLHKFTWHSAIRVIRSRALYFILFSGEPVLIYATRVPSCSQTNIVSGFCLARLQIKLLGFYSYSRVLYEHIYAMLYQGPTLKTRPGVSVPRAPSNVIRSFNHFHSLVGLKKRVKITKNTPSTKLGGSRRKSQKSLIQCWVLLLNSLCAALGRLLAGL
jgi:hypothetical protein